LTVATLDSKANISKLLKGLGWGLIEIARPNSGNAFWVVYAATGRPDPMGGERLSENVDPKNKITQARDQVDRVTG